MYIFLLILSGVFGAIVGSFLNVVIYRLGTGTISKGRSICLSCGNKLRLRDLFPVISFLMLRGKCGQCESKISSQYITVETIMMFISVLIFMQLPLSYSLLYIVSNVLFYTIAFAILLVIFFYDLKHKIIPDELSFLFAGLSFVALFFTKQGIILPGVLEILAGPSLALIPA
jgi:leader peptidase (prepilin peptidase)/N-methyltransferase